MNNKIKYSISPIGFVNNSFKDLENASDSKNYAVIKLDSSKVVQLKKSYGKK
ncbi:MAG TPA: hypothetical protein PLV47_05880 [Flavobacterium sp.]|jgi:hypothetical protein|uniref:hypothetical protein n=1 Tax=Flavobacterium sp. TaxID=239 RepID=UPI001B6BFAEB|nr:hypothetical protein [Flavobacterium sp.]MBP7181755.1 hypothetical protein [Flavobacterium sp.]MBP7318558.1 hypothetical protein [Flavobacterium sp.]MBP8887295.1 hypothetical protein [Flavobacterium sp.]HRL72234.1 hypothetical protein [Flavobacterium sp.]HRM12480.1 hypothetical protein [Flavobacterium sp.]